MSGVRLSERGFGAADDALSSVLSRVENLEPLWDAVGRDWFAPRQNRHFARARFKPLSPEYAIRKRREVGVRPTLVYTGRMRDAVSSAVPVKRSSRFAVFGLKAGRSDNWIAQIHQKGSSGGRVPKRVVLPNVKPGERKDLAGLVARYIESGV